MDRIRDAWRANQAHILREVSTRHRVNVDGVCFFLETYLIESVPLCRLIGLTTTDRLVVVQGALT